MISKGFLTYIFKKKLNNLLFVIGYCIISIIYFRWISISTLLLKKTYSNAQVFCISVTTALFLYSLSFLIYKYKKWKLFSVIVYVFLTARVIKNLWHPYKEQPILLVEYTEYIIVSFILTIYYIMFMHKSYLKQKKQ